MNRNQRTRRRLVALGAAGLVLVLAGCGGGGAAGGGTTGTTGTDTASAEASAVVEKPDGAPGPTVTPKRNRANQKVLDQALAKSPLAVADPDAPPPVPSQQMLPKARVVTIAGAPDEIPASEAVAALEDLGFPMRADTDQRIGNYILGVEQSEVREVVLYQRGRVAAQRGYVIVIEFASAQTAARLAPVMANQDRGADVRFFQAGNLVVGYTKAAGADNAAKVEGLMRALARPGR